MVACGCTSGSVLFHWFSCAVDKLKIVGRSCYFVFLRLFVCSAESFLVLIVDLSFFCCFGMSWEVNGTLLSEPFTGAIR